MIRYCAMVLVWLIVGLVTTRPAYAWLAAGEQPLAQGLVSDEASSTGLQKISSSRPTIFNYQLPITNYLPKSPFSLTPTFSNYQLPITKYLPKSPFSLTPTFFNYQLPITNFSFSDLPPLCSAVYQLEHPSVCPDLGAGHYARQLELAGVSYPLPPLHIAPELPYRGLTPAAYARIITDTAPVYRSPYDAIGGLAPLRRFEKGFEFVSLIGTLSVDDQNFYQINPGEFMRAEALQPARPSGFQGHFLSEPAGSAVGWVIVPVQPSLAPGQPANPAAPFLGRYQWFQVLGLERVGDWNWYRVGPDQWVEQRTVALVQPSAPGGAGGTVISVDTYEQSLGVYVDGRLVFATLVSSGSRYFPTRPGTFQVWAKLDSGKMSGAYLPDRRDYYFLEDVPWILYYDGDRALHGAYWHDNFGIRSSHGCVNLSPRDARWLFGFASVGATVVIFSSG